MTNINATHQSATGTEGNGSARTVRCRAGIWLMLAMMALLNPQDGVGQEARRKGEAPPAVSLDKAVSDVRRTTGARVLSAETERHDGQGVHRIRVLTEEGQVRRYDIDERTGRPMSGRYAAPRR